MSTETAIPPDAAPASDAPAAPWYSTAYDPATPGKLSDDWLSKAPDDMRKDLEPYAKEKDPFEIAFKAVGRVKETQRALHEKRAADAGLPPKPEGEAATPEALAAYYQARNLPVDPTGYALTRPADFPEALWNDAEAAGYAKLFHELELTPDQVKALSAHTQGNARQALAAHQQAVAAQQAAEAKAKADYIQREKEGLVQDFGANVDPAINKIKALCEASKLDPECFNPDNPDKWLGRDTIRALASLVKMIPSTGDFTRQKMGGSPQVNATQDRAYWQKLDPKSEDGKAWNDSSHPRHKEVAAARAEAYRMAAELADAK